MDKCHTAHATNACHGLCQVIQRLPLAPFKSINGRLHMPAGRRERTPELYKAIVDAFRQHGPSFSAVGRTAGVDRRTALLAWEAGWPELGVYKGRPIKVMMEELAIGARAGRVVSDYEEIDESTLTAQEKRTAALERKAKETYEAAQRRLAEVEELANARISDAEKSARAVMGNAEIEAKKRLADLLSKAKVDAAETLADEAAASKFGRKAAMSAVAIAALIMKDAQGIATALAASPEELKKLPPTTRLRYAEVLMQTVASAEKALILSMQAERLRVGQPTEVLGIQTMGESNLEEKELKARVLMKAIERAKARGNAGDRKPETEASTAVANGQTPVH